MSDQPKGIYQRLRAAQLELKAPKTEGFRFGKSRSAEMVLEAAKPVLDRHGLTLITSEEITFVEGRHYVKQTATVYDDAGDSVSAVGHAWEGEVDRGLDASQVTGKTSSYAKKYALGNLLSLDDTKDADHKGTLRPERAVEAIVEAQGTYVTREQLKKLLTAAGRAIKSTDKAEIAMWFYETFDVTVTEVKRTDFEARMQDLQTIVDGQREGES